MTPEAWVDLAYSALVAGAIALLFREYDADAEVEQWLTDSVRGFDDRGEGVLMSDERTQPGPRQAA